MNSIYIYGLIDPDSHKVRYVGATSDLGERYNTHISRNDKLPSKRALWLKGLKDLGKKPNLILLEVAPIKLAANIEKRWCDYYKDNDLVNFFPVTTYPSKVDKHQTIPISIRLEESVITKLKFLAESQNIGYQRMIKRWIDEKLQESS